MTPRSQEILEAAVREFIKTGEPISSGCLYRRYGFGIKPAMIRLELCGLTEEGYLKQPYPSAGRVPTDFGFKFYAERSVENAPADAHASHWEKMLESGNWDGMLADFSRNFGMVGVLAEESFKNIQKDGLEYLFDHLDTDSRDAFSAVARDIENIPGRLAKAEQFLTAENFLEVFVGKNPVTQSDYLSVLAADYDVGPDKVFFFAIGPKRMDYEGAVKAMKGMKQKSARQPTDKKNKSQKNKII